MEKAFEIIKQLAADFKTHESAYLSPSYHESQLRQDFIDKFFTALGWDVTHTNQKNPYEQEVHIENKVHMAGSQRRADYAFLFPFSVILNFLSMRRNLLEILPTRTITTRRFVMDGTPILLLQS